MIVKKTLPADKELVLVKITKILPHGAYCTLTDYNLDAYLPISEIASGWIKNIHEFIKEGQKDVARVISVDREKNVVDVSLKKVTKKEREDKISEQNTEKRSEMLFEQSLKLSNTLEKKEKIKEELLTKVESYSELVSKVAENKEFLSFLKNKPFADAFTETVIKNIKPKHYEVSYLVELRSINSRSGITTIKKIFGEIEQMGVKVLYVGAPRYRLSSEGSSYPDAEERIKEARKTLDANSKSIAYTIKAEKLPNNN